VFELIIVFIIARFSATLSIRVTADPDDDDRDGHRNVGTIRTPNAADSPRRLDQVHSPRKHQDL